MNQREKAELAAVLVELIDSDAGVSRAILNVVRSCPNIVLEY